jgi:hypothetical protein
VTSMELNIIGALGSAEVTIAITPMAAELDGKDTTGLFERDAKAIADMLWANLPGGTVERLIGELALLDASRRGVPNRLPL